MYRKAGLKKEIANDKNWGHLAIRVSCYQINRFKYIDHNLLLGGGAYSQ